MSHFQEHINHTQYTRQCRMAEAEQYRLQVLAGHRRQRSMLQVVQVPLVALVALSLSYLVGITLLLH